MGSLVVFSVEERISPIDENGSLCCSAKFHGLVSGFVPCEGAVIGGFLTWVGKILIGWRMGGFADRDVLFVAFVPRPIVDWIEI
jgi:hypothetical protein